MIIPKPKLKYLNHEFKIKILIGALITSTISGIVGRYAFYLPRQKRRDEFERTYDWRADYERMKKTGTVFIRMGSFELFPKPYVNVDDQPEDMKELATLCNTDFPAYQKKVKEIFGYDGDEYLETLKLFAHPDLKKYQE